jgi:hypothetical protein
MFDGLLTASISPSASVSPSIGPSASVSPSASISPSASRSPSASVSLSISPSSSQSPSASGSPSASVSSSSSPSPSIPIIAVNRWLNGQSMVVDAAPGPFPMSVRWINGNASINLYVTESTYIEGTVCWGQATGVTQANTRTFASNWTGTGAIEGTGNDEKMVLVPGEYMESEVIAIGSGLTVSVNQNYYGTGDNVTLKYRTAASYSGCITDAWTTYTGTFRSSGFVQIRAEEKAGN